MAATKLHTKIKRNACTGHWPASGVASTKAVNSVGAGRPMFYRTATRKKIEIYITSTTIKPALICISFQADSEMGLASLPETVSHFLTAVEPFLWL